MVDVQLFKWSAQDQKVLAGIDNLVAQRQDIAWEDTGWLVEKLLNAITAVENMVDTPFVEAK